MTQIDLDMFEDELAQDVSYNGSTIRAFVSLGGGINMITIKASDVPTPSPQDQVTVNGSTAYVRGHADQPTNGETHTLELMPMPAYQRRNYGRS